MEAVTHRTSRCLNLRTVHVVYPSFTLSFTHFYEKNRVPIHIRHSAYGWGSEVKYDFCSLLEELTVQGRGSQMLAHIRMTCSTS